MQKFVCKCVYFYGFTCFLWRYQVLVSDKHLFTTNFPCKEMKHLN